MAKKILFNETQVKDIINKYESGASAASIGKEYSVSSKTIRRLLDNNNIKSRGNRKHFYKENIFAKINTAEKAYWLGFITADGYINEDRNFMRIKLQECDKTHLEKFVKFIKGDEGMIKYEFHNTTGNKLYYVEVNGKNFINNLVALGVRQRKSMNEQWCKSIPDKYIKDYIRGIIDGDGSLNIKRRSFDISCSKQLLEPLQDYLICNYNTTKTKIYNHCNTHRLYVSVNAVNILNDLYYKRCVALDRKKEIVKNITNGLPCINRVKSVPTA